MSSFFSSVLYEKIHDASVRLSSFVFNKQAIGREYAEKRLIAWCSNFENLLTSSDPLVEVVSCIRFISDAEILNDCISHLNNNLLSSQKFVIYTCLGETSESSSRIMGLLKGDNNYVEHISDAIQQCHSGKFSTIATVDDFLNTGRQFTGILKQLFGVDCALPLDGTSSRSILPKESLDFVKRGKIKFYFCFRIGTEVGRLIAMNAVKKLGINAEISVLEQYCDDRGIFGRKSDVDLLLKDPRQWKLISSRQNTIFQKSDPEHVREFLNICREAGCQILKKTKPLWPEDKINARTLGYGNSAQLFITQKNIPTSTITCLWKGGDVSIKGHSLKWEPLLERREKIIGGQESNNVINYSISDHHHFDKSKMDNFYLDFSPGKSSALDFVLLYSTECSINNCCWEDVTHNVYIPRFMYNPKCEPLDTNHQTGLCTFRIQKQNYARFQNRTSLTWSRNKYSIPLSIVSIDLFCNNGKPSLTAIRFKVKYSSELIGYRISDIHYLFRQLTLPSGKGDVFFRYKSSRDIADKRGYSEIKLCDLISNILKSGCLEGSVKISPVRPLILSFIRLKDVVLENHRENILSISQAFAALRNESPPRIPVFDMDADSMISISERSAFMIAGGSTDINCSGWHNNFLTSYLMAYVMVVLNTVPGPSSLVVFADTSVGKQLTKFGRPWYLDNSNIYRHKFAQKTVQIFTDPHK